MTGWVPSLAQATPLGDDRVPTPSGSKITTLLANDAALVVLAGLFLTLLLAPWGKAQCRRRTRAGIPASAGVSCQHAAARHCGAQQRRCHAGNAHSSQQQRNAGCQQQQRIWQQALLPIDYTRQQQAKQQRTVQQLHCQRLASLMQAQRSATRCQQHEHLAQWLRRAARSSAPAPLWPGVRQRIQQPARCHTRNQPQHNHRAIIGAC